MADEGIGALAVLKDSRVVGMRAAGVRHLPVMDDNHVVGMISMRDLLAIETWG